MPDDLFDFSLADTQGTNVDPISPKDFNITKYTDFEAALLERNRKFWSAQEGVQVFRRFRVPEVFAYGCRDMKLSLSLQLAGLQRSMAFKQDIANFLEPWYGIGVVASAFGLDYIWNEGQAPGTRPRFSSVKEALDYDTTSISETQIGIRVLSFIEYFLEMTKGKIPISLTDTQSPWNVASYLIDPNSYFIAMFDCPDALSCLLDRIVEVSIRFTKIQIDLIGDALVMPGHGFASSRNFSGIGMSDDNMMVISAKDYINIEVPANSKFGIPFGGIAFHSCGNWSNKIHAVQEIKNLRMVDGAFSGETDPSPNPPEPFVEKLANSGVIINSRVVGSSDKVVEVARRLVRKGMKVIVVTYCDSPQEQKIAYDQIHEIRDINKT